MNTFLSFSEMFLLFVSFFESASLMSTFLSRMKCPFASARIALMVDSEANLT